VTVGGAVTVTVVVTVAVEVTVAVVVTVSVAVAVTVSGVRQAREESLTEQSGPLSRSGVSSVPAVAVGGKRLARNASETAISTGPRGTVM
jgi:hypothetical protein